MLDPFHLGQQAFESINKSIYSSSGSTAPPKRTSADITQKVPQNIYLYNYQAETAIFLATKHEKTVMACSYLFFKYFLHFKLLKSCPQKYMY